MKGTRILLAAAVLLVIPSLAFAANGDTLNIGGQVPLSLNLTVTPVDGYDNLDLHSGSVTLTPTIATIDISTNNSAGWELWVYAANAVGATSSLINADGDALEYTLTFDATLTAGVSDTGLKLKDDIGNGVEAGTPLIINYDQDPTLGAGYYSDQLSIVLRAK